jgi:PAS domain S-box-containing protein
MTALSFSSTVGGPTLMLGPLEDVLAEGDELRPVHRERLEVAQRNSLRLLKLVNTLLDFSRIEAGRIQVSYEPTDLAAFSAELASVFRSAVERAGLRLVVDCPPLAEPVHVDREMWEKIVLNLLSNAFKFTFEGEIEVSLRQAGETVELVVRDTGTGIPAEKIPHLFERFHRVKGARGRTFEGSGIGLALVHELVKLHGGTVRVESAVDRGTTFTVSLPTGTAHLPAERIGAARTLASTSLRGEVYVDEALRWLPEGGFQSPGPSRSDVRARVLVADDNADMREYVGRLLSPRHDVVAVDDGAAALRAAREQAFDLVLSDVMMPGLDGFELLRELRADERTRETPVILLSARAGEESIVEGMEAGADGYLVKPFSAKELRACVASHLRLQGVRRAAQAALRASEAKFATAFDRSPLGLTITALDDGRLVEVNEGFVRLSGYTREEALGSTPDELGLWMDPELRAERFAQLRAGGHVPEIEARFRLKSGEERIGVIGSALVEIGGRPCVLSSVMDITARKRMEEALREADRRKDEFLAMLGHELRNPLAPIRNAAQVLKLVAPENAQQRWAREVIERQAQHLTRLVDDLLDVSRITRGKITLSRERLDVATLLQRAVETSRPLIDERGHHLTVTLPPQPLEVEGDLTRLVQIVGNLLNNAAKYTDEGGHIRLSAAQEDGEVVIRVCDNGIGLSAELLPQVFDLFTQANRSLDRSQGGLGIGLTLVRQLAEMHGGTVEAKSDGAGQGSEFIVRLPAAASKSL